VGKGMKARMRKFTISDFVNIMENGLGKPIWGFSVVATNKMSVKNKELKKFVKKLKKNG
jgi:hypothetical protein